MTLAQQNASRPSTSRQSRAPARIHKKVLLTLGGDDDDEDELVVSQIQANQSKGPNDPNNIINIARRQTTLSRMEICELFAEIVKRVELCDTFELENWLDKYLAISKIIDFAKISILLFDSAQIWGRKVDGLYELITNFHSVQIAVEEHQVEVIKKRTRKEKEAREQPTEPVRKVQKVKPSQKSIIPKINLDYRIATINDNITNRESLEIPNLVTNQLLEIKKLKNTQKEQSLREKLFGIKNIKKFNDRRKRRIPIFDEIFKIERNSFFISRIFENFGLDELYEQDDSCVSDDLGDQDTIGSRRDYSVFMSNMNEEFCIFRSYNYKKEYDLHSNRVQIHNQLIEDYRKKWLLGLKPKLIKFPSNNFPMLLPAEYLKTMYGSQIYDNSDYLRALREEKDCWNKYKNIFGQENRLSYCILLCYRVTTDEIVKRRIIREMTFACYTPESEEFGKEFDLRYKEEAAKLEMFRSMYRQIAGEKQFDPESYSVTTTELTSCSLQKENFLRSECFQSIESIEEANAIETQQSKITETTSSAQLIENISQPFDRSKIRVSIDSGYLSSTSPIPLSDLDRNQWEPIVVMTNIDGTTNIVLDDELKLMMDLPIDVVIKEELPDVEPEVEVAVEVEPVPLVFNMFQIPEHLLRKTKIFQLPEEFDIWKNVRKRKGATVNEAGPKKMKAIEKIPASVYLGVDDPEEDDFLGFEEEPISTSQPPLETTILETSLNNSEVDSTLLSQDSGYESQLSVNDSTINLNLSESQNTSINSRIDETMLREAELEVEEENCRTENVENWTEYVTPLLSQAKSRSNFDIQKYGQDIITQFTEIGSELSFHSIMENKRPDFTARNFLSMLMLANTENIQITNLNQDINRPSRSDEIQVKLLTREMFYETNYDMENIPKRVKKSCTKKDAPLLNILPLCDNPIEISLKICSFMQKESERKKRSLENSMENKAHKRSRPSTSSTT